VLCYVGHVTNFIQDRPLPAGDLAADWERGNEPDNVARRD